MNKREMLAGLIARRAEKRAALDAVLAGAEARENKALSDEERSAFDAGEAEVRSLDGEVKRLDESIRADEAAAEVAKRYAPKPGEGVRAEPEVYRSGGGPSYFKDLFLARNSGDFQARTRLERNNQMVAEKRALTTTNGAGGEFVPPLWLEDQFIEFVRPGRITANLVPTQALPAGTDSINIPKVNSGTAIAPQASQNTGVQITDLTTTSVASSVVTLAGGQTVSLQLLEQSPLNIDDVILRDLAADYAKQLNTQILTGSGSGGTVTGIMTQSGTTSVLFNSLNSGATAATTLYSKISGAIQSIHTSRFLPPDTIIMHPRRWAWLVTQVDTAGRPLVTPRAGAYNPLGAVDGYASQGMVGEMLGLPVYVDALIPTNLTVNSGTGEDAVIVARMSDLVLWESNIRAEAFQQTYANNLSVFIRMYNYMSFQPGRYPQSIAVITGSQLAAPSF